jgi:hypothetical protein
LVMAIVVLVSRPVTSFLLFNHMTERINQFGTFGGAGGPGFFGGSYRLTGSDYPSHASSPAVN